MTDIITVASLASHLQRTIADEHAPAVQAVELANGLVSDELSDELLALDPVPTRVKAITLEVAARGYRNPEAASSIQTSIDDYDKIVRREGNSLPPPGFYVTDEEKRELAELSAAATTTRRRAGSIRLRVKHV